MEIVARTFEFIEASLETRSCDELTALVMRTVEPFGVTSFLDSGVPRPGERCSDHVLINAWPSGWYDRYTSRRYFEIDPVIGLLQQTTMPTDGASRHANCHPSRRAPWLRTRRRSSG